MGYILQLFRVAPSGTWVRPADKAVVEGGPVTLEVVAKAIEKRIPVVVVEGSGRAADILAYAWRMLHGERCGPAPLWPCVDAA